MSMIRVAGLVGFVLTVFPSAASSELRKERVVLRVATQSGAPAQVRLITRGLIYLSPRPTTARSPWQTITTLPVPTEVWLAGVGEADIVPIDSAIVLVVDAYEARRNPAPTRHVAGPAIRISRQSYSEAFRVTHLRRALPEKVVN